MPKNPVFKRFFDSGLQKNWNPFLFDRIFAYLVLLCKTKCLVVPIIERGGCQGEEIFIIS